MSRNYHATILCHVTFLYLFIAIFAEEGLRQFSLVSIIAVELSRLLIFEANTRRHDRCVNESREFFCDGSIEQILFVLKATGSLLINLSRVGR